MSNHRTKAEHIQKSKRLPFEKELGWLRQVDSLLSDCVMVWDDDEEPKEIREAWWQIAQALPSLGRIIKRLEKVANYLNVETTGPPALTDRVNDRRGYSVPRTAHVRWSWRRDTESST